MLFCKMQLGHDHYSTEWSANEFDMISIDAGIHNADGPRINKTAIIR